MSTWLSEKLPAGSVDPDSITAASAAEHRRVKTHKAVNSRAKAPPAAIFTFHTCEITLMLFGRYRWTRGCWTEQTGVLESNVLVIEVEMRDEWEEGCGVVFC